MTGTHRGRVVRWVFAAWVGAAGAGCLVEGTDSRLVTPSPFRSPTPPGPKLQVSAAPPSVESAARVDQLGRKLLAANPAIGLRPWFKVVGDPRPEVFHIGTSDIVLTEGLVQQCKSDGELAALISSELGEMVSQREALAGPEARLPDRPSPLEVRIGTDNNSTFGGSDDVHQVEMARYEQDRRRARDAARLPPDPQALGRLYLKNAGYPPTDFDAVAPLRKAADQNATWEKQMTTPAGPTPSWTAHH